MLQKQRIKLVCDNDATNEVRVVGTGIAQHSLRSR